MASALAMDKWRTKLLWEAAGINTPHYIVLNEQTDFDRGSTGAWAAADCQAVARRIDHRLEQGDQGNRFAGSTEAGGGARHYCAGGAVYRRHGAYGSLSSER